MQDRPRDNLQPHAELAVQNPASEYRHAFGVNVVEFSKVSIRYNFALYTRILSLFVDLSYFCKSCDLDYK